MINLYLKSVDSLNIWLGRIIGWVMIFIMFVTVYDVIGRRFFGAPLPWAFDVSTQLFGLHFMLVAAYTLLRDEHVSVYIFSEKLSTRNRAILEIVSYLVFFFPFIVILFYYGWSFAERSWSIRETSWGAAALPVYYIKTVIPLTAALLFFQGVAKIIRLVRVVREGELA